MVSRSFCDLKNYNDVPWTYVISDNKGKEVVGTFYEKELRKTNQKEFRVEKVIQRKDNKLYIKWNGCDSSFNSWIDKKDIVDKLNTDKLENVSTNLSN